MVSRYWGAAEGSGAQGFWELSNTPGKFPVASSGFCVEAVSVSEDRAGKVGYVGLSGFAVVHQSPGVCACARVCLLLYLELRAYMSTRQDLPLRYTPSLKMGGFMEGQRCKAKFAQRY